MFACFALSPQARAVCQDACLTNFNTVQGDDALVSLTTGFQNTAVGFQALFSNTTGDLNTATGASALLFNTTGRRNTATGAGALVSNRIGDSNTATGASALNNNTIGRENTATGDDALGLNTSGSLNTANGFAALFSNTIGGENTATGVAALVDNATGNRNTANGVRALGLNTTGSLNTANGVDALSQNETGNNNTANGVSALSQNTTGRFNTASGGSALFSNTTGIRNIALGFNAGFNLTTGSDNIDIGNVGVADESSTTRIGLFQTRTFIAGIRGRTTGNANAIPVLIDSAGQLGTMSSSERFKKEIKPMDSASESILALTPVTFHYKSDATGTPQFGLVAEEVAKVNPDLIVRDEKGEIYTVRYDAVNAMLLNEFLKEHRKNEEQEKTIAQLKSGMTALAATVKEQAVQIQKVSAQLEASKPAPQVVNNP
jgi:hypothetical protein